MPENYSSQSPAYHGVKNAKYSMRTGEEPGTEIKNLAYIKAVSFDPQVNTQPIYANDMQVMAVVSDKGYTGNLGVTAQDRVLEKDLGQVVEIDKGQADVNLIGFRRLDLYYEYTEHTQSGVPYTVKVWALNLEVGKASKSNETDEDSLKIGEYQYPITVYGDKIKAATGEATYRDANGNELVATRIICLPNDEGYATFDSAVPAPKMKAEA